MRKNIKYTFSIFALIISTSCAKTELEPVEYLNWCDDSENELIQTYKQGDIEVTCQYMSAEYSVLKQSDPDIIDEKRFNDNVSEVDDLLQFKIKFQNTTSNNFLRDQYTTEEAFNTRSMYLGFGIQTDLELITGSDTVACNMNHHERTYGNTPYETLLITFPKTSQKEEDMQVVFNDRVFGLGRVKFFFEKSQLEQIPTLKW